MYMKQLLDHLDRIAKANNDEFEYSIDIVNRKKAFELVFIARETADRHEFIWVGIPDNDITKLVIDESELKDLCHSWNYKYVE